MGLSQYEDDYPRARVTNSTATEVTMPCRSKAEELHSLISEVDSVAQLLEKLKNSIGIPSGPTSDAVKEDASVNLVNVLETLPMTIRAQIAYIRDQIQDIEQSLN